MRRTPLSLKPPVFCAFVGEDYAFFRWYEMTEVCISGMAYCADCFPDAWRRWFLGPR